MAHFDFYQDQQFILERESFFKRCGLDPQKKLILFATKSPNSYAWNTDVAKTIISAIENDESLKNCQLLTRVHPIFYRKIGGKYRFQNYLDEFYQLRDQYQGRFVLNEPHLEDGINYAMPEEEMRWIASLLKYSSVVVNLFSTMNIEAALFDTPIVNVCYDQQRAINGLKSRYDIKIDLNQTHNQRIVNSGGVTMAYSDQELIQGIKAYLADPSLHREGREIIATQEGGPFPGTAGKTIAKLILEETANRGGGRC